MSHALSALAAAVLLAWTAPGWADDAAPATTPALQENIDGEGDSAKAAQRWEFLNQGIARYAVHVMGETIEDSPLVAMPLLRYQNPLTSSKDGILVAFSRGGRPDVLATLCIGGEKSVVHEFYSVCGDVVEVRRDGRVYWHSPKLEPKFQELTDVQAPAATEALRSIQMRKIAEEFSVMDDHGWREKTKQPLRLLRQPVHRYSDADQGIIDGAIFAYVLGTDPEADLLLEAYTTDDGPRWRFLFSPQTIYALQAYRNDSLVWEIEERRIFCNSTAVQYVCPYPFATDDVSLAGMMPESKQPAAKP